MEPGGPWAGVDVGARKGFDAAVVDRTRLLAATRVATVDETVRWLNQYAPSTVAVDSPRRAAPDGRRSRDGERALAREVCGIRYTPDTATVASSRTGYYDWILHGLELYAALDAAGMTTVECFPTASWTRWAGARKGTRAAWTRAALRRLELAGVPARTNQDARDAIAAAVTARLFADGATCGYEEIVVPRETERSIT